jgi:hypothetical protein
MIAQVADLPVITPAALATLLSKDSVQMKMFSKTSAQALFLILAIPALQGCMFTDEQLDAETNRYSGSNAHPIVVRNGKAIAPKCGRWGDVTDTRHNLQSPNHGCAVQHNIAVMMANPKR